MLTSTFLFWNLCGKALTHELTALAHDHDVDVLIIAEPGPDQAQAELLRSLNSATSLYRTHKSRCPRIQLFSRFPKASFTPLYDDNVTTITRLQAPLSPSITLVAVHYWSKAYLSNDDQASLIPRLREMIDRVEQRESHQRTLLVGDFNMDPFDLAMVNSEGVHAVMSAEVAGRRSRIVKELARHMFFNPMWSVMGDSRRRTPGTYYKDMSGKPTNYFWHTFDQVLVRPDIVPWFEMDHLQVLTSAGHRSLLLPSGIPNQAECSDHLPLLFRLAIPESI